MRGFAPSSEPRSNLTTFSYGLFFFIIFSAFCFVNIVLKPNTSFDNKLMSFISDYYGWPISSSDCEEDSSYMSISKKMFYSLASDCFSAYSITYCAKDSNSCSSSCSYSCSSSFYTLSGGLKSAKKSIPYRTSKGDGVLDSIYFSFLLACFFLGSFFSSWLLTL